MYSIQFFIFPAIIDYFNDGWSAQLFVFRENDVLRLQNEYKFKIHSIIKTADCNICSIGVMGGGLWRVKGEEEPTVTSLHNNLATSKKIVKKLKQATPFGVFLFVWKIGI